MRKAKLRQLNIALLLNRKVSYSLDTLSGIQEFARKEVDWILADRQRIKNIPQGLQFPWDGFIIQAASDSELEYIAHTGKAAILVSGAREQNLFHSVVPDNVEIGRQAAQHFLDQGQRHFLYVSHGDQLDARQRLQGFQERIQAHGSCHLSCLSTGSSRLIRKALQQLNNPAAVFAYNDKIAVNVLHQALAIGKRVPEELSVLGVDNDLITGTISPLPLSSIDPDFNHIGFCAAQRLQEELTLPHSTPRQLIIPPRNIHTRLSSDVLAFSSPITRHVLEAYRERLHEALYVDELAEQLNISRRTLEMKFKQDVGISPHAYLLEKRMQRARELLRENKFTVKKVAEMCGYPNLSSFSTQFKKTVGLNPARYQERSQRQRTG